DDPADIVSRAGQVAEDDGGGAPVVDEGEHDAADDDHLGRPEEALAETGGGRCGLVGSGHDARGDVRSPQETGTASVQATWRPFQFSHGPLPGPADEVS